MSARRRLLRAAEVPEYPNRTGEARLPAAVAVLVSRASNQGRELLLAAGQVWRRAPSC
jgi:hypothetical protein